MVAASLVGLWALLAAAPAPARGFGLAAKARRRADGLSQRSPARQGDGGHASEEQLPLALPMYLKRWRLWMGRENITVPDIAGEWPRVALGVFMRPNDMDRQFLDRIRTTWVNQPLACNVSELGRAPQCRFGVTFVTGLDAGGKISREKDFTTLPMDEYASCGKSWAWFNHAATAYPQATHIAKMDCDAFPHLSRFLSILLAFRSPCDNVFGGRSLTAYGDNEPAGPFLQTCLEPEYCPPTHCGHPVASDFLRYNVTDPRCFSYMHGAFYFMTRPLAVEAAKPGGWWHQQGQACHPEDVVTGHAVQKYGAEKGVCVASLHLNGLVAYAHVDHPRR